MKKIILFVLLLTCSICKADTICCLEPHAHFYIQPYGDFTRKEAVEVSKQLTRTLSKVFPLEFKIVKILPNKPLPKKAYYKPRNRYLANVLLQDLPSYNFPGYTIGLTHKDISYKMYGYENYGIIGLTASGKCLSIVSDYRAKGQKFVNVIVHEIGHGVFNLGHCSNKNCIMCNHYKGKVITTCKDHTML